MFYTSNVFNLGLHIANHVGLNEKLVKILAAQSMSVIKKDKDKEKNLHTSSVRNIGFGEIV